MRAYRERANGKDVEPGDACLRPAAGAVDEQTLAMGMKGRTCPQHTGTEAGDKD
jgi:hypothetical protein